MEQEEKTTKTTINHSAISTQIESTSYDTTEEKMTVKYKSGGTYEYLNVPLDMWQQSMVAPSIGRFMNTVIKPNYKFNKIS